MNGVVVAGGGLGALRTAESLRASGFAGPLTVIGNEDSMPYNRPPLSKGALLNGVDVEALEFPRKSSVDDVDWMVNSTITKADLTDRLLTLDTGEAVPFDALVIATGIRPRRLPFPGPTEGRFVLRTAADAAAVRARLRRELNLVILGSGFLGCEVAATARALGAHVTVIAADHEPMVRPLGDELSSALRRRHEAQGVHFRLGHTIEATNGGDRVRSVTLDDGTELLADVLIEAVGSVPNVEWLEGNGLDLSDGVETDSAMRVPTELAPVVAVGDIARHPNALFGSVPRRVEHWSIPTETGRRAGQTLAQILRGEWPSEAPFTAMPSFWSDQYALRIQSFGMPDLATDISLVDGDLNGPCIVEYRDPLGLVGVVGIDRTSDLIPYRKEIAARSHC